MNNPAAFPACNEANVNDTMGMTLRDYFAGQALSGILASDAKLDTNGNSPDAHIAGMSYLIADAMLAARGETS